MEDDQQKVKWAEGPSGNGNGSRNGGIIDEEDENASLGRHQVWLFSGYCFREQVVI